MREGPCCPWALYPSLAGILALPNSPLWENSCPALKLGQLSPAFFSGEVGVFQRGLELPRSQQGEVWAFKMPLNKQQVMTNTYCYSPGVSVGVAGISK